MFTVEGWHRRVAARRHRELRASIANGPRIKANKQPFVPTDFGPEDPWADPKQPAKATPAQVRAAVSAANARRRR